MRLVLDPEVYAKGSVHHPDHGTVHLAGWHRVLMDTEQGPRAMRHVHVASTENGHRQRVPERSGIV